MANTKVAITFRQGVKVDDIHAAVQQVIDAHGPFGPGGCRTCGLVGIDLELTAASNPEFYSAVHAEGLRTPGVLQVSVTGDPERSSQ